jgi:hypothetical protein
MDNENIGGSEVEERIANIHTHVENCPYHEKPTYHAYKRTSLKPSLIVPARPESNSRGGNTGNSANRLSKRFFCMRQMGPQGEDSENSFSWRNIPLGIASSKFHPQPQVVTRVLDAVYFLSDLAEAGHLNVGPKTKKALKQVGHLQTFTLLPHWRRVRSVCACRLITVQAG